MIEPDKIWRLHAYDDSAKQNELCKYMGINFDSPLSAIESYTTESKGHELTYHKIYVTNKKGVYLDLQADEGSKTKRSVFMRLGKVVDEGYIASLRNE